MECLNCGEEFPPAACRWRCPACGLKASSFDGSARRVVSGRKFRDEVRLYGFDGE